MLNQGSGNYQLRIKTTGKPTGYEIKGIYIECRSKKNNVETNGDHGYPTGAYGISTTQDIRRYMGPLHIKLSAPKCGWDVANGESLKETLTATVTEIDVVLQNGGAGTS